MKLDFFGFFKLIRNNEKVEDIYGILKYRYNIDIDSIISQCVSIDSNNILDDISSIVIREVERSISENFIIENTSGDYISIINNTGNKNKTDLSQILKYNLEACQVYLIVKTLLQYRANESLATVITSQKYELRSDTHIQPHKKSPLSHIFEDAQGAGKKGGDYKKNSLRYIGYLEPCHISSILTASINPYSKLNNDEVEKFIKSKGNFVHSPNVLDKNDFYKQYKRTYIGIQNNNRTLNALNAYATEKIYGFNLTLCRVDLCVNVDVGSPENVTQYIKQLYKTNMRKSYKIRGLRNTAINKTVGFTTEYEQDGTELAVYNKKHQLEDALGIPADEYKNILRIEFRLKKQSTINKYVDDTLSNTGKILSLIENSKDIIKTVLPKLLPGGDYYKLDKAIDIVYELEKDTRLRRTMEQFLRLTAEKHGLKSARAAMKSVGITDRYITRLLKSFEEIEVNPVALKKNSKQKFLPSLYRYLE